MSQKHKFTYVGPFRELFSSKQLPDGKSVMLIDIGTHFTRIGFEGEHSPRAVMTTFISKNKSKDTNTFRIGNEISEQELTKGSV